MGRQPSGRVSSEATRRVASTVAFRTRAGIEATADNRRLRTSNDERLFAFVAAFVAAKRAFGVAFESRRRRRDRCRRHRRDRVLSRVIYYSLVHLRSMFVLVSSFAFAVRDGGVRASQHSQLFPGVNHRVAGQPVERLHVVHGRVEPLRDEDERLAGHHHVRLGPELRRDPERLSRVDDRVGVQVVQALNHAHRGLVHLADQTQRVAVRHDVLGVEDDHGGGRVGEGSGRAFVDATRRRVGGCPSTEPGGLANADSTSACSIGDVNGTMCDFPRAPRSGRNPSPLSPNQPRFPPTHTHASGTPRASRVARLARPGVLTHGTG